MLSVLNYEYLYNFSDDTLFIQETNNKIIVYLNNEIIKEYDRKEKDFDSAVNYYYKRGFIF